MFLLRKNFDLTIFKENENFDKKLYESVLFTFAVATIAFGAFIIATAQAKEVEDDSTKITLNTKTHNVISVDKKINEIVMGESVSQRIEREAREKAEAEARAKAEAEAKVAQEARKTVVPSGSYGDPSRFDSIYQRAAAIYGVDWRLLRAIHYVETGQSGSTSKKSYAGATGPMQFLPSTWNRYKVDGNSDGVAQITNVDDAIFAAANYLKACGYPNVKSALWGYNPSTSYYYKVMSVANSLGFYA